MIFDQFKHPAANARSRRRRNTAKLAAQLEENEQADCARYPEDGERWKPFLPALREALEQYGELPPEEPVDAGIRFFVTEDRMYAYACILPPLDGGAELRLDAFGRELQRSGITAGIDEEAALDALVKQRYLHLFPVARGTFPVDGADGRREDLFEPRPVYMIEGREGTPVDFRESRPVQLVRRGDTVSRVVPATPGKEGVDVTGCRLPCRSGIPADLRIGANLELSADGLRLEAAENGAVFAKDGVLFVQTAIVRIGALNADDSLVWMAYIDGDIPEGVKVESTSNVFVMGEIRGAEIRSNGSVRAQKGIRKGSRIEAKGQVLACVIEDSQVKAGKDIYAEEIRNSDVASEGCVFATGGNGLIQGGAIRARERVECVQIGSSAGGKNQVFLGNSPELTEKIGQQTKALDEVQATLEMLRKNILNLRKGGQTLSLEKRGVLSQLVEQKELYESRAAELEAQLRESQDQRRTDRDSQLVCQKMHPHTVVQIGERTGEFLYPETQCRIHLYAGQVVSY